MLSTYLYELRMYITSRFTTPKLIFIKIKTKGSFISLQAKFENNELQYICMIQDHVFFIFIFIVFIISYFYLFLLLPASLNHTIKFGHSLM